MAGDLRSHEFPWVAAPGGRLNAVGNNLDDKFHDPVEEAALCPLQAAMEESQFRIRRCCLLWIVVGIELLVRYLQGIAAQSSSQGQGFINIDCGASAGSAYQNPDTGLTFQSDATMIFTGQTASTEDGAVTDLSTLRYFPAASSPRKNCYDVPVTSEQQYLVRAWFHFGGYAAVPLPASGINFQLAVDETVWMNVTIDTTSNASSKYEEVLLITNKSKPTVSICLIRIDSSDPFISSLELRPCPVNSYVDMLEDTAQIMRLIDRRNFGELNSTFRFPYDDYDRIWPPWPNASAAGATSLFAPGYPSPSQQIVYNYSLQADHVPPIVLESAMTHPSILTYSVTMEGYNTTSQVQAYISLFLADINNTVSSGLRRVMDLELNFRDPSSSTIDLTSEVPPFTVDEYDADNKIPVNKPLLFALRPNPSTDLSPLLNAIELYHIIPLASPTSPSDVTTMASVKLALNYSRWTGYPCNPVPWDEIVCTDNAVTSLDLSGKGLSGTIPTAISELTHLTSLNLSDNQLSGPLPPWIVQFTSLDVSNNNLSGTFPADFISRITDFRYSGNLQLQCVPSGNAVCPPTIPPTGTTSPSPVISGGSGSGTKSKSKSSVGPAIAGVVGGVLALLLIIFLVVWFGCRKKPTTRQAKLSDSIPDGGPTSRSSQGSNASHHPVRKVQAYTLSTVKEATNNFARKLGEGGFGPVYYGKLKDQKVAVKVMSATSQQGLSEYSNEIDLLSTVHYKKLVSLVGYCEEGTELILLYEYMSGGDLRARLYSGHAAQRSPLTWRQRLQIALDAARGLEYLHHGCNPAIFHRDVTSGNILLNSKLEAKVADFGLAKLTDDEQTRVMTMVKGTLGYLDPEYHTTGMLTNKSDVYSFGVVLLEILCGQPPVSQGGTYRLIVEMVRAAINTRSLLAVVDSALQGSYKVESVWRFAEIAISCAAPAATARPSMRRVVYELSDILEVEGADRSAGRWRLTVGKHFDDSAGSSTCSPHEIEEPSRVFHTDVDPR